MRRGQSYDGVLRAILADAKARGLSAEDVFGADNEAEDEYREFAFRRAALTARRRAKRAQLEQQKRGEQS